MVGDGHGVPGSPRSGCVVHCNVCSMVVRDGSAAGPPDAVAGGPRRPRAGAAARPSARCRRRPSSSLRAGRWRPGSSLTAARLDGAVRRPAGQPPPRPRRPLAAGPGPRLLHDRLVRPRGQRARRRRPAADRPGAAALPLGRLLPGPGPAGRRARRGAATCCSACWRRPTNRSPAAGTRCSATPRLAVIPQTSTIASHLPRAMGVAFAIGRARRLGVPTRWPADALAVATFGDASLNHSTAQGAINAAVYTAHQGVPMPLLLVCEDNGLGISVPTPPGWVEASLAGRPGLRYERVESTDPVGCVRRRRGPRRARAGVGSAGRAAPAHRALRRARRDRRRVGLPHGVGDAGRAAARSAAGHGPGARRARRRPGRARRPLPRRAGPHAGPGRRSRRTAAVAHAGRGHGAALATAPCRGRRPRRCRRRAGRTRRVLRPPARGRGAADAGRVDQPHARRPARRRPPGAGVRRGRRGQGWRLRRDPGPAAQGGPAAGVRHVARRAVDPRPGPRGRRQRAGADPRDPVPGLPAQRHRPAARRGGQPGVLLQRAVHQPAGRAHRRLRLPAGLRWPLPQRQRHRRAARHPRAGHRLARPPGRRAGDAAHLRGRGRHRRHGQRVPRADRALPHPRPARSGRRALDGAVRPARAVDRATTCRSGRRRWPGRATTCSS